MKTSRFKALLISTITLAISAITTAQISIINTDELVKVKEGTTYFAMKDPSSPSAKAYVAAAEKYWSFSKVACIQYKEIEQHIAPNASFITIGGNMSSSTSSTANTKTRLFLEFWTTDGTYKHDPKKRRHFNQDEKIILATMELFPDYLTQANPSLLYKIDYDGDGHLKNWSDGIFGNMLQMLCIALEENKVRTYKEEYFESSQVKALSSTTLYIPEYVLTKFDKYSGDESNKQDEKDLMADYPYSYKLVTTDELNAKINDPEANIYYLLFIKSGDDRIISITNSKTGLIIYSAFSGSGTSLKPSDLKTLAKLIGK